MEGAASAPAVSTSDKVPFVKKLIKARRITSCKYMITR